MELLTQLLQALWAQAFETLANPSMIGMLYFVLFVILFLENGLLPAAFLPGDSLLVLVGVLIAKGAMGYPQTILLLTVAASLGCWVSYIQGRWLGNTRTVQNWLSHLPAHYHQRALFSPDNPAIVGSSVLTNAIKRPINSADKPCL